MYISESSMDIIFKCWEHTHTAGDLIKSRQQKFHRQLVHMQPCSWTLSVISDGGVLVPWVHIHLTSLIEQLLSIKIHIHVPTSLSLMAPLL